MKTGLRFRFWIETTLTVVSAMLFVLTVTWPQWIEGTFGIDPDGGSGGAEWAIALGLLALTMSCGLLLRSTWRRLKTA